MVWVISIAAGSALLWGVAHRRLQEFAISGPLLMVLVGALIGLIVQDEAYKFFNSEVALLSAELLLALILFTDATNLRGTFRSHFASIPLRLLLIALPLSLILTTAVGLVLPMHLSFAAILCIACIAVPSDFAPEARLLRDGRVPARIRRWLSIESGYNDGLLSPIFLGSLALAASTPGSHVSDAGQAILLAAPSGLIAILVGGAIGIVVGGIVRWTHQRGWTDAQGARIAVLALPFLTFVIAVALLGNGFVAAFVCGVAYRLGRGRGDATEEELVLADDVNSILTLLLWLAFGVAVVVLISEPYDWWPTVLLAIFTLTLGRFIPVYLALGGTRLPGRDKLFIASFGPRGVASIVFGLIAFNRFPKDEAFSLLAATAVVVLGSLLIHGISAPFAVRALYPPRQGFQAQGPAAQRR
ncbi:cation:proton antiporter [Plantibacter sp. Mn2098]|uniref:cation:proton antiporter domain-containing protein n=1 Tax=Plantibacter sp. Mn2098 TaxID=3395266 RepID=UPI003BDADB91